jgi:hypothetical protein
VGKPNMPSPQAINVKPPTPLIPALNSSYTGAMKSAGPGFLGDLTSFAKTGSAPGATAGAVKDLQPLLAAMKDASTRGMQEGQAAIEESFGASGMRFSSDLMRSLVDYRLQSNKDLNLQVEDLLYKGTQGAQARALTAGLQGSELFSQAALSYAPTQVIATGGGQGPSPIPGYISAAASTAATIAAIMLM